MPQSAAPHAAILPTEPDIRIRRVTPDAPGRWLERGARDAFAHPGIGLTYGLAFAACGWLLTLGLARAGMGALILPLAGGFLLVAPVAAGGLYEVSRRRERGEGVTLAATLSAMGRNPQVAQLGLLLLLLFLAWIQVAMGLLALFYGTRPPALDTFVGAVLTAPQGVVFLAAGTAFGGALAAVAFAVSAVSTPMLLDRDVSALTAVRASLAAVWLNRKVMVGWAATLATLGALGLAFLFAGLAVTLPIAAHSSWHAYRELVDRD